MKTLKGLRIGLVKEIFEQPMNDDVRQALEKAISFYKLSGVEFVDVSIPNIAQAIDMYYILSSAEAVSLASATSLDSLAVGFSAGLGSAPVWLLPLAVTLVSFAAVLCGTAAGKKAAAKSRINLSWISGAVLVIIAVTKLF